MIVFPGFPMRSALLSCVFLALVLGAALAALLGGKSAAKKADTTLEAAEVPAGLARATFGAGCFWCTEAVFQQLQGVQAVVPGYSGGAVKNPSYQQVCTGRTGHAEAVQITYDPAVLAYEELLEVFWQSHDPTTRDRQGNDVGPQYRSVIFYHSETQRRLGEEYKQKLDAAGIFARPIVTQIVPFVEFYRAEEYHQNYFVDHPTQPYCVALIGPKVDKMRKLFPAKLKPK